MLIRLHKNARTTPAVRQEIQDSDLSERALAKKHNISRATARKWKKRRGSTADGPHRPHTLRATLGPAQEAVGVELRKTLLLPRWTTWWPWPASSSTPPCPVRASTGACAAMACPASRRSCPPRLAPFRLGPFKTRSQASRATRNGKPDRPVPGAIRWPGPFAYFR
jgi:hypothetical protein